MNFYSVFKQLAFKLDPENVHDLTIHSAHFLPFMADLCAPLKPDKRYEMTCGGLTWSFPVGLAAGFDKNALAINFFKKMGLGSVEVGTVTKMPQVGNKKPRIKRHSHIQSVQNSMGFPNHGSERILANIQKDHKGDICLGVNIGKNKTTIPELTPTEYADLYTKFAPHCDYLVVNISSPNTPGLRNFQKKELLSPILEAIKIERSKFSKPVLIKIAPDLLDTDLKMICELSKEYSFNGIIATNTTIQHDFGAGGLSGNFIKEISRKCRLKTCEYLREDPSQMIIGVGGIDSYSDIKEFWRAGGSFTQIYTSLIYHGPELLKTMARGIEQDLKLNNFDNVQTLWENIKEID